MNENNISNQFNNTRSNDSSYNSSEQNTIKNKSISKGDNYLYSSELNNSSATTIDTTVTTCSIKYSKEERSKGYADSMGRIDRKQLEWAWHMASSNMSIGDIAKILDYFFTQYSHTQNKKHEKLGSELLVRVIESLKYCRTKNEIRFGTPGTIKLDIDMYKAMVDYFFANPQNTTKNARGYNPLIMLFMRDRVRERCYYEACKKNKSIG